MRRQHTGRPGTRVVPAALEGAYRTVVARTLTARCTLRRPGTVSVWDPASEQNRLAPHPPYYDAAARVQALGTQARQVTTADDEVVQANYLVVVPATVSPAGGDLVHVTDSGDPLLDGRTLLVREVATGSVRAERDLFCTLTT